MIIKQADNRESDISELQFLLELPYLSAKQRFLVEREIKFIKSGIHGEKSSTYYIDFALKNSRNSAVIHDLRIEHNGLIAQIDHVVVHRTMRVFVLETKNYYYGIKITPHGEFLAWNGRTYIGIESPIEQNLRHISVLRNVIGDNKLLPSRLGIQMSAEYKNLVMVSPTSRVDRPQKNEFDTDCVIKADAFGGILEKILDETGVAQTMASIAKVVSPETLESIAEKLASFHRPIKFNYAEKFGIEIKLAQSTTDVPFYEPEPSVCESPAKSTNASSACCEGCGCEVDSKTVYFCRFNKAKFDGKTLCRKCQGGYVPGSGQGSKQAEAPKQDVSVAKVEPEVQGKTVCAKCGDPVDNKVAFYCRVNKQKFGGMILCRKCQ